jgi:hypothetical protein
MIPELGVATDMLSELETFEDEAESEEFFDESLWINSRFAITLLLK